MPGNIFLAFSLVLKKHINNMQIAFWSGMVKSLVSIGLKIITMGRAVRASYKPRFSANLSNRRSENLGLTKFRLKNKG